MNVRLPIKTFSFRNPSIKAWLLGALAFGASGFAMADDAAQQPAVATYHAALQAKVIPERLNGEAGNRVDWNVDYPSQLAPQAVSETSRRPVSKMDGIVETSSRHP
ncbi:hypothetical protein [Dyella amyloliquefaciens]|uniref:hypothetical protein n=1 Tax=Dyella amyloliquefaciens TaxID=1770545 RepID=UPI00102E56D2|nr:hypothetical protein [Dyella amyloliquefaciens]